MSDKEMTEKTSLEVSRPFDSSQDVSRPLESPEPVYVSRPLESAEDTPALSIISICKEQASIETNYIVEKLDNKDHAGYVATWKDKLNQLLPISSACAIASYWLYFSFRVRYTVAAQNLRHTVYPVAWLFLSIELGVACETPEIPRILDVC